ncbi:MAG: GntR family transcriptional regulator, partial [Nocardia sp.]|nr:GntR family transcriptional regulator [Nocardia sp.]
MAGALAPEERLGEERLAERYGVSRTPVREALARLQADGLVERHDAGLFPYRPRLDTLGDYYELRITLEVQGIARVLDDPELGHERAVLGPEIDRWRAFRTAPPDP